jgi:2-methylcitrate dehydratase PrpD
MTGAERIADFALGFRLEDLPPGMTDDLRLRFLDALGVGLAASAGTAQQAWAGAFAAAGPAVTLAGTMAAPAEAAMLNGALIHSLEYDDTHIGSVIHGSAVAAPLALAATQAADGDGSGMLAAYVIAWEVMIRIGLAAPGAFQARGVQATAVAGAIGSAAAAAATFGLSRDAVVSAIGIAGSQASGLLAFLEDGSSAKALNPGWAAHTGIIAASLSKAGMTGPARVLESRFGPLSVFGADPDGLPGALDDLGQRWGLAEAAYKLYPCCHYIHPFLEILQGLMAQGLAAGDVRQLTAHVAAEQAPLIADPWDRRQAPRSGYDGKWGLAYCMALLLCDGAVDVAGFEAPPRAPVVDLARRMEWVAVEGSGFPATFPARIDVVTTQGKTLSASVQTVRGAPGRPIARDEVLAKFHRNAARRLSPGRIEALCAAMIGAGAAPDLAGLGAALRG